MHSLFGGKSHLHAVKTLTLITALTIVSALFAVTPRCFAGTGSSSSGVNLDKHARKVHRELTHFNPGNYIRLTFTDGSDRTVSLDSLEDTSFTATNAETNNRETHTYDEIARVSREKHYVDEGSERHIHHIRMWVPITAGVLAAGAVATALLVR